MVELVEISDGVPTTTSLKVGGHFDKTHYNVLRKIDELVKDLTIQKLRVRDYFIETVHINDRNREYRIFEVTRDGFSLLAMSFTGVKALKFKTQYIKAFNAMEKELKEIYAVRQVGIQTRRVLTDEIKDSGENERMKGHGFSTYTKLAYKLAGIHYVKPLQGTNFRDTLSQHDLDRVENIESMMKALIKTGRVYGEIKKDMEMMFNVKKLKGE